MRLRVNKRALQTVLALAGGLALLLAAVFALRAWEETPAESNSSTSPPHPGAGGEVVYEGMTYVPRKNLETVLILGLDKAAVDKTIPVQAGEFQQSDFLMLLVLDHVAKTCTPLHLNRDTMVEIDMLDRTGRSVGSFMGQLTLAHASGMDYTGTEEGGCRSASVAVSRLLGGVKVDHYLSLTLDAVPVLNDVAGGVPVKLLDDYTWLDPAMKKGETAVLQGDQALIYVRDRTDTDDKTNLGRMERQRQYLTSFRERCAAKLAEDNSFLLEAVAAVSAYLVSDCTVDELASLAQAVQNYEIEEFITLPGEAVKEEGYMEFHVDEIALHKIVIDIFYVPKEE